jgi:hypothetical protein
MPLSAPLSAPPFTPLCQPPFALHSAPPTTSPSRAVASPPSHPPLPARTLPHHRHSRIRRLAALPPAKLAGYSFTNGPAKNSQPLRPSSLRPPQLSRPTCRAPLATLCLPRPAGHAFAAGPPFAASPPAALFTTDAAAKYTRKASGGEAHARRARGNVAILVRYARVRDGARGSSRVDACGRAVAQKGRKHSWMEDFLQGHRSIFKVERRPSPPPHSLGLAGKLCTSHAQASSNVPPPPSPSLQLFRNYCQDAIRAGVSEAPDAAWVELIHSSPVSAFLRCSGACRAALALVWLACV